MIDEKHVMVPTRNGERIALRIYRPEGSGRHPALYAASPYRYDNNEAPETGLFPWRETGPVEWYVDRHQYVYVHADVLGTGRSEGKFRFFDRKEQQAHHDVIEWIAAQPWCNGKVGGIGQSYYCMSQWFMAIDNPPSLACIGAYDGMVDLYQYFGFSGGIEMPYATFWYQNNVRLGNLFPATGEPRDLPYDLPGEVIRHPLYDEFWRERSPMEALDRIRVPLFSIGIWGKRELHLAGNIMGYQRAQGPKKLHITAFADAIAAQAAFSKIEFHEEFLLPFYDHYLKGLTTSFLERPPVAFATVNAEHKRSTSTWPPENVRMHTLYLTGERSGAVVSLNDGTLSETPDRGPVKSVSYSYPHEAWTLARGTAVLRGGKLDPLHTILTFTSPPLAADMEVVGHPKLSVFISTSNTDTDLIVRLTHQMPPDGSGQDSSQVVSRGLLRASHRVKDPVHSTDQVPVYDHSTCLPLTPGEVYKIDIPMQPTAYVFRRGGRIRIEISNHDSPAVDGFYAHLYVPSKKGTDTFYFGEAHPSSLILPVWR